MNIQVLRSVDKWSAHQKQESSVYNAYIAAIKNAEHFIYIENQFFISSQEGFWRKVQNKIQAALVERIVRAYKNSEDFHVMVFTPLNPEFPGDLDANDLTADAALAITFWNQASIYHGEDSLFRKLEKHNISKELAKNFFSVFSLRTYDLIGENYVTELVYVHSKVMIVDDRKAIIGSANINDRSMLGGRDSEVAVIIEDLDLIDGEMNGVKYFVGKFSHSLRCNLLKEHLGLLKGGQDEFDINVNDPLTPRFLAGIQSQAELNTIAFLAVFGPGLLPNENVQDFKEFKRYKDVPLPRKNREDVKKVLKQIKGNIVNYPCTFLIKELRPSWLDFGYMYANHANSKSQLPVTLYA